MNMAFNRFLSRQQVIESYQIPERIEGEIFAVLRPVFGSGEDARYLESHVSQELHRYGQRKLRLRSCGSEFSQEEDIQMASSRESSWASTVEKTDPEGVIPVEPILVNEKTAASMLGVSRRTVFDLNKQGVLTCKQIGKLKRYAVADLRAFAEGKVA